MNFSALCIFTTQIKELLINSLRRNTDKYIEATKAEDIEKIKAIDMASVHEAYQCIIRYIGSKNGNSANPHAGMTLEQMRKRNRRIHAPSQEQ